MKIVIFGLTISSTWGNGHATVWRALARALTGRGHAVLFFERDVPYYAENRDLTKIPGGELLLYRDWDDIASLAKRQLADADVGLVTSFCPDGLRATELLLHSNARLRVFYDLDTPITLARLGAGEPVSWIGPRGLRDFDLVLSFTGGRACEGLRDRLGAQRVVPLYGSVDPEIHRPAAAPTPMLAGLSYLGTYSEDRQKALETLFIGSARARPDYRFVIAGAQYPQDFPWCDNIFFVRHLPVPEHPGFFASSRMTLNVTRAPMAAMGHCPSGRLFEAAACGTPIVSDVWDGIGDFYEPGREILLARSTEDVLAAMALSDAELGRIAEAARERTLDRHTGAHRAREFERALDLVDAVPSPVTCGAALMET
jgi:spore maturation protein CgeB